MVFFDESLGGLGWVERVLKILVIFSVVLENYFRFNLIEENGKPNGGGDGDFFANRASLSKMSNNG